MMPEEISVRQWQEMFRTGIFDQDDMTVQEQAGWSDFYDPLNDAGLQNLAKLVMSVTHPFILDNYHVYFMHHTPAIGPMFGCVYFDLLSDERSKKSFHVALDSPHERKKWTLTTRRHGDRGPGFECGDIRSMSRYINNMAHELEQGENIKGAHVYCPEDAGKALTSPEKAGQKSHKRREPER